MGSKLHPVSSQPEQLKKAWSKKPLALCVGLLNAQLVMASPCDITVDATSQSDTDATTTLAEALAQITSCSDGGMITIADTLAGETLQFGTQPILISDGVAFEIVAPEAESEAERVVVNVTRDYDDNAVSLFDSATLTLKNLKFVSDAAPDLPFALFRVDSASLLLDNLMVDGITIGGNQNLIDAQDSRIDINNTAISNNRAQRIIHTLNTSVNIPLETQEVLLTVSGSVFENNQASSSLDQGVIVSEDITLEIRDSVFDGNTAALSTAATSGGVLVIENSSDISRVVIENTEFKNNQAGEDGGAVFAKGRAQLELNKTRFSNNQASTGQGGAIYLEPEGSGITLEINDSQFSANTADTDGGAIAVNSIEASATVRIQRSTFSDQLSGESGGAFYSRGEVSTEIINSTLVANKATDGSSVASLQGSDGQLSIHHSTITDNTASGGEEGHTIFVNTPAADLEISHSVFHNNIVPDGKTGIAVAESEYSAQVEFTYWDGSYSGTQNVSDNGGNIVSADDPGLGELQDNGGETETRMPAPDSVLLDAGDANISDEPDTDQRGSDRILRGVIDLGAVEYGNMPPVGSTPDAASINRGDAVNLDASAWFTDPEGDDLTFSFSGAPAELSIEADSGVISGTAAIAGDFTITVTATDTFNASSSVQYLLTIINQAPAVTDPAADLTQDENATLSIDASGFFTDPEGDGLTFSLSGAPAGVSIDEDSGAISGSPAETGDFTVTVTATDALGASTSTSFMLSVTESVDDTPVQDDSPGADDGSVEDNSPAEDSNASGGSSGGVLFWLLGLLPLALISRRR